MTKETKELFDLLKDKKTYNSVSFVPEIIIDEVTKLESKLKEMEVYLTKGGIILDKNGKQCHVGDNVTLCQYVSDELYQVYRGKIIFDTKYNQLYIYTDSGGIFNPASDIFELIEE